MPMPIFFVLSTGVIVYVIICIVSRNTRIRKEKEELISQSLLKRSFGESMTNDDYIRYRNAIDAHFDTHFDFNTLKGINKIPVKPYVYLDETIGSISYILQRKASVYRNERMDLAIACLRKANKIAPLSKIMQTEADFMRLVEYLLHDGQFDEARKEFDAIRGSEDPPMTTRAILKAATLRSINWCKNIGTDLIMMNYESSTCGECAKYRGRVYSISGKDKRYPKLPEKVYIYGGIHAKCGCSFYPWHDWESCVWDSAVDLLAFSNRPFVDDRTPEEIKLYEERMARINEKPKYDDAWFEKIKQRTISRQKYFKLCELLPGKAPKSFSGYRRMQSQRTVNYLKLVELAKGVGLELE